METGMSFGLEGFGVETNSKDQKEIMEQLQAARETGIRIFTLDYAEKPKDVDKAIRFAQKNKFVPYVAPGMGFKNNKLPRWPRRPLKENSHTISNVQLVKNFVFIEESSRFGRPEEYAMKMHNTNYDMVVTGVFHHRSQTLGRHNVRTMQFKKLGSRRPVLAHVNIGYADSGAFYWKDSWRQGNPTWVLEPAAFSTDQYMVQYWHPSWHQLMYGNTQSYIYGIIKEGYDGIVIDGANAFEAFANPE
jgi:endo-alpha-1,4-polygalactosaminidase (GH114 family)